MSPLFVCRGSEESEENGKELSGFSFFRSISENRGVGKAVSLAETNSPICGRNP
jgi:hypothetical protein